MRGSAVTGICSSLASVAQVAAQNTVRDMSSRLLSEPVGLPWVPEIGGKVRSIVRKEVVPLLPSRMTGRGRKRLMQSVGRILGVTYVADYALEHRYGFNVDDAAEHILCTARTMGIDEQFAREEIGRLQKLYRYECNEASDARNDCSTETRYLLKCSDVVFVQLLVLHASGEGADASTERALRCAGAALEVYDDLVDRDEDAGNVRNPFAGISAGSPDHLRYLLREIITPFMAPVKDSTATAADGVVGRYCCQVLARLEPLLEFHENPSSGRQA